MACVFAFAAVSRAQEPPRLALLIGNTAYKANVGPLENPGKDVELVGAALRQLGFSVAIVKDADYRKMDGEIRRYVDRVREAGPGAVSFFYYSGHGVARPDTSSNYLIPVDVERADTDGIWYASFEQSAVIDRLNQQAPEARHLIVFDACRDELNLTRAGRKALGVTKGFVPVREVRGMLIAYATAEKRTAADTGIFAKILAKEIVQPGVEAVAMFRRVQLRAESEMSQEPWMSLRYLPETFLAKQPPQDPARPDRSPRPPLSEAAEAWSTVHDSESEAVLEAFIGKFGQTVFADFARARLAELRQRKAAVGILPERPAVCDGLEVNLGTGERECIKPGSGKSFRDCPDCPEMVVVPAGRFQMGSPENEEGRNDNEGPRHEVRIAKAFAMGRHEVTAGQYLRCVRERGCPEPLWREKGNEFNVETGSYNSFKKFGEALAGEDFPIVGVSWHDAAAYVIWLSNKTARDYRLPSEAEWEYAARAGTLTRYSFGDAEDMLGSHAWFSRNSGGRPHNVGLMRANGWGLHDIHGNVAEWVQDCFNANYNGATSDGSARQSGDCGVRVLRGGSWNDDPRELRTAGRGKYFPTSRIVVSGFRLARTLNP